MTVWTTAVVTSRAASCPSSSLSHAGAVTSPASSASIGGSPSVGEGYQVSRTVPSAAVVARPKPQAVRCVMAPRVVAGLGKVCA